MPYFPMIDAATPCRRYTFGGYHAVLLESVRSAQTIQYHFVLLVFRGDEQGPCLAVASEYSDALSKASPFLGVFPGEGHHNLGDSVAWRDRDTFAAEAVKVMLRYLQLPESLAITVEETRQKPWWKFW